MSDACGGCGLEYTDFRSGHDFSDIYKMLWVPSRDTRLWKQKTRTQILGKWRQVKKELWAIHLAECDPDAGYGTYDIKSLWEGV